MTQKLLEPHISDDVGIKDEASSSNGMDKSTKLINCLYEENSETHSVVP